MEIFKFYFSEYFHFFSLRKYLYSEQKIIFSKNENVSKYGPQSKLLKSSIYWSLLLVMILIADHDFDHLFFYWFRQIWSVFNIYTYFFLPLAFVVPMSIPVTLV